MDPTYLTIDLARVAVYRKGEDHERTILFVHGNSLNAATFQFQMTSEFDANLIAVDLPGHGNSESPKNPEEQYSIPGYASFIQKIVEQMDLTNLILVGHSLGGHAVIEAAPHIEERVIGIVIFGAPPVSSTQDFPHAFNPLPAVALAYQALLSKEECLTLAQEFVDDRNIKRVAKIISETDGMAREKLGMSVQKGVFANELEILKSLTISIALLHGNEDRLINREYLSGLSFPNQWRNQIHLIQGAGHTPQLETPALFNEYMRQFLEDVSTKN